MLENSQRVIKYYWFQYLKRKIEKKKQQTAKGKKKNLNKTANRFQNNNGNATQQQVPMFRGQRNQKFINDSNIKQVDSSKISPIRKPPGNYQNLSPTISPISNHKVTVNNLKQKNMTTPQNKKNSFINEKPLIKQNGVNNYYNILISDSKFLNFFQDSIAEKDSDQEKEEEDQEEIYNIVVEKMKEEGIPQDYPKQSSHASFTNSNKIEVFDKDEYFEKQSNLLNPHDQRSSHQERNERYQMSESKLMSHSDYGDLDEENEEDVSPRNVHQN